MSTTASVTINNKRLSFPANSQQKDQTTTTMLQKQTLKAAGENDSSDNGLLMMKSSNNHLTKGNGRQGGQYPDTNTPPNSSANLYIIRKLVY